MYLDYKFEDGLGKPPVPGPNDTYKECGGPMSLAWSDSPYGPWQTRAIADTLEWHDTTNPSPIVFQNGSVLLTVSKRWIQYGTERIYKDIWTMWADNWDGNY